MFPSLFRGRRHLHHVLRGESSRLLFRGDCANHTPSTSGDKNKIIPVYRGSRQQRGSPFIIHHSAFSISPESGRHFAYLEWFVVKLRPRFWEKAEKLKS
jgi:hypothetical protein